MAGAIEIVSEAFKKSLNPMLWLFYFLLQLVSLVAFLLLLLLLAVPAFLVAVAIVPGNIMLGLVLFCLLALVGIVLLFYLNAIIQGTNYFLAKNFIDHNKLSISDAFNDALPRANSLFAASIIVGLFFLVLFFVLLLPALLPLFGTLSNFQQAIANPLQLAAPLMTGFLLFVVGILVFVLFAIAVLPFNFLVSPLVAFEQVSAIAGIKKAITLSKQDYFSKLAAVIVFVILSSIVGIVFAGIDLAAKIVFQILAAVVSSSQNINLLFTIIAVFVSLCINFVSIAIVSSLSGIFAVYYYRFNIGSFFSDNARKEINHELHGFIPSERETKEIKLESWMGKRI